MNEQEWSRWHEIVERTWMNWIMMIWNYGCERFKKLIAIIYINEMYCSFRWPDRKNSKMKRARITPLEFFLRNMLRYCRECKLLDDKSPTSTHLGNDHEFIIKEYSIHWSEAFREIQSKVMTAYAQSGQYHIIVESRVPLTWYQSHTLNLVVPIDW